MSEKRHVVAVIARNHDGKYLMQMRDSQGTNPLVWCPSCGCIEPSEGVFEAAAREFEEETGQRFGPVRFALRGFVETDTHVVHVLTLDDPIAWPSGVTEGAGWGFFSHEEIVMLRNRGCLIRWMWDVLERYLPEY